MLVLSLPTCSRTHILIHRFKTQTSMDYSGYLLAIDRPCSCRAIDRLRGSVQIKSVDLELHP